MKDSSYNFISILIILIIYIIYISLIQIYPNWLDSPEFAAASYTFGLPHPPGHPVYMLLTKLFLFIPLGSIALRSSFASVIFIILGIFILGKILFALYLLILKTKLSSPFVLTRIFVFILTQFIIIIIGFCYSMVIHGTRSEVYALQFLIHSSIILLLFYWILHLDKHCISYPMIIGFLFGISLCNHHFLALLFLPSFVLVFMLVKLFNKSLKSLKVLFFSIVMVIYGLFGYIYLPLRSIRNSDISLSSVFDLNSFLWVVSAKAFQKALYSSQQLTIGERTMNIFFLMIDQMTPVFILLSIAGIYFLLRKKDFVIIGLFTLVAILTFLIARAKIGFDPFNPDVYGYLLTVNSLFAVGFFTFLLFSLNVLVKKSKFIVPIFTILFLIILCAKLYESSLKRNEFQFNSSTDTVANNILSQMPVGSLFLTNYFFTGFDLWYFNGVELIRPDITHIHVPFLTFPGYFYQKYKSNENIKGLLEDYLTNNTLSEDKITKLALVYPLFAEADLNNLSKIDAYLYPEGPIYEIKPETVSRTELIESHEQYLKNMQKLSDVIGRDINERDTKKLFTWWYYLDTLIMARNEQKQLAIESLKRAISLAPEDKNLLKVYKLIKNNQLDKLLEINPNLSE